MSTPSLRAVEPAAVAETVRVVLIALVAVGWVALDEQAIMSAATAVGAVLSVVLSAWTRAQVKPLAKLNPGA